jgi:hypothetical protein
MVPTVLADHDDYLSRGDTVGNTSGRVVLEKTREEILGHALIKRVFLGVWWDYPPSLAAP